MGLPLEAPGVTYSDPSAGSPYVCCTLTTPYQADGVEIWYTTTTGATPIRGVSEQWTGKRIDVEPHVKSVSARTFFRTAVPSPVTVVSILNVAVCG